MLPDNVSHPATPCRTQILFIVLIAADVRSRFRWLGEATACASELTPEELVSAIADLETAEACEASKFRDEVDDAD